MFAVYWSSVKDALARRAGIRRLVVLAVAVPVLVLVALGRPAEAAKNRSPTITTANPSVAVGEG